MYITKRNHNQSTNEEVVVRGREFFCSRCLYIIFLSLFLLLLLAVILFLFCDIILLAKLRKILILVRKKNTTNWLIQNNQNYKIIFLNY